jgi:hypothetical protein
MNVFFKIMSLIFMVLFALAAIVQWNDPDAWLWYFIYGIPCIASLVFFLGRFNYKVGWVLFLVYAVAAYFIWPDKFEGIALGEGEDIHIEKGREALGLLLVSLVMLVYTLITRRLSSLKI